ncbi:hypothetical protein D3C73_680350 [compost metagenome]
MQHKNRSKLKKFLFGSFLMYIVLCLSIIVPDYKSYVFLYYRFIPDTVKIHAKLEVSTGPMYYLDDEKSIKMLRKFYPEIDTYEIELKGEPSFNHVDDPARIGDLTVYGEFHGVTDRYKDTGYGDIPVFEVKYYDDLTGELFSPLAFFIITAAPFFLFGILWCSINKFNPILEKKTGIITVDLADNK